MPASRPVIVGVATGASLNPLSPEDDEDDICPVCESECTCQNRSRPSQTNSISATAASGLSTSTFNAYSATPSGSTNTSGLQSLKIKLTLPPSLKHRSHLAQGSSVSGVNPLRNSVASTSSTTTEQSPHPIPSAHHLALGVLDPTAPKRRGRPPKAVVAAREAAKAALAAQNASGSYAHDAVSGRSAPAQAYTGKGKHPAKYMPAKKPSASVKKVPRQRGKTTTERRHLVKGLPRSYSSADYSDDGASAKYPTFVSAASSSSPSSSSESSDSESSLSPLDSDLEEETRLIVHEEGSKPQARKASGSDGGHKRWEIRPRQRSVGLGHEDADVESDDSSEGGSEASDEDTDEEIEQDADVDADTEGAGLEDADLDDDDETSSRIGITFSDGRGAGWSDDEESSFDADLFFANLDGSDSDSSPEPLHRDPFAPSSDYDFVSSMSADEEDALLLMDMDPSVQIRRGQGEFEFGLELGDLSFGWDGQVFFTTTSPQHTRDLGLQTQGDIEMQVETEDEMQDGVSTDDDSATVDELMLNESDGETTEDELIGPDGLPNSRAMMLFRWPTVVSTVDPQSTISNAGSPAPQIPPNASESLRIALASYAGQQGSPAPTPADILAGRVFAEEMEELEMERSFAEAQTPARKRVGGLPAMGEFMSPEQGPRASAVIDGKGPSVPSPFPRSKVSRGRHRSTTGTDSNEMNSGVVRLTSVAYVDFSLTDTQPQTPSDAALSSTQSSEEAVPESQLEMSEMSSAEVIDLDDVLDASFLDCEPISQEHEAQLYEASSMMSPATSGSLLSRWDRIPMATFRRTREFNKIDGSASDTGLSVFGGMSSIDALLTPTKTAEKKSNSARRRGKAKGLNTLGPPFELLTRDGDRTPTSTSPQHGFRPPKKELRREKAMMKRKMTNKPLPPRHQAQFRTHHHHPNHKSRASGSMQRMSSYAGSSSPSFGL